MDYAQHVVEWRAYCTSRIAHRISDDPSRQTRFLALGREYADRYWTGDDRHPLTVLRRLLRLTNTAQEYLEAKFGFHHRLRQSGNFP